MCRYVFSAIAAITLASHALAQPVNLAEKSQPGDVAKFTLELDLKGNLLVVQDKEKQPIPIAAKARHVFDERVISVTDGLPVISARNYGEAVASVVIVSEKNDRSLPADRKLILVRRNPDSLLCLAPAGPLTRNDLDLVTEHFNPQCLPGLLPGKAVNVGDTWQLSENATQASCLFDSVIKTQLTGKLLSAKDGVAIFTIEGTAEGIENGAKVTLSVNATGSFDTAAGRISSLTWKQKDDREQGVVNPASQVEVTVTLKREGLAELPKELSDEALAKVPVNGVPTTQTDIRYTDPKARYTMVHSREWHITGQTDTHLVLRLLDHGEFAAQATITIWRKAEPGKHMSAEDFKRAVSEAPGWTQSKLLGEGEVPTTTGCWLYKVSAEGKMENVPVTQNFYLIAGPQGDQLVVTVAMKPDKVKVVGTRDTALVKAIEFGKK
jgi:hypothetical protein